jgi:hypothetical protein
MVLDCRASIAKTYRGYAILKVPSIFYVKFYADIDYPETFAT